MLQRWTLAGLWLSRGELERAREDLATATTAAGFRAGVFAPFDERLPRVLEPRQRLTYHGFQKNGLEDVLAALVRGTPGGYRPLRMPFRPPRRRPKAWSAPSVPLGGC